MRITALIAASAAALAIAACSKAPEEKADEAASDAVEAAGTAADAALTADQAAAAVTPGYEGNQDLQAMAKQWSNDLGESADEAMRRIYRGGTMQASSDVAKAQRAAAFGAQRNTPEFPPSER